MRVFGYTPRTAAHAIRIAHLQFKLEFYKEAKIKVNRRDVFFLFALNNYNFQIRRTFELMNEVPVEVFIRGQILRD